VIATGFERAAAAAEPLRPYATQQDRTGTIDSRGASADPRRDDLNVPAFIRKKAD